MSKTVQLTPTTEEEKEMEPVVRHLGLLWVEYPQVECTDPATLLPATLVEWEYRLPHGVELVVSLRTVGDTATIAGIITAPHGATMEEQYEFATVEAAMDWCAKTVTEWEEAE